MAEISPATIASWMQLGFAVAVAWFLLTKSLPRAEERADKRDASFIAALEKQHEDHAGEVRALMDHHERQTDRLEVAIWSARAGDRKSNNGESTR